MDLIGYYRDDQSQAMSFCLERGIRIYPVPVDKEYKIIVEYGFDGRYCKESRTSDKLYSEKEVYTKINELYCYEYDRNL